MGMVGLGQAGSNICDYAYTKNFNCVVANTASVDLKLLKYIPEDNRLYLSNEGAGRNREIGKQTLINNAEKFHNLCSDKLKNCDVVFVNASGGGGTGSGAIPVAIDILSDLFEKINIINILPDKNESPSVQINAYDCFAEISQFEQLGSVLIIDNNEARLKNNNKPKYKVLNIANKKYIDILYEINKLTEQTSYTNNFDKRDFIDILNTRGCLLLSKSIMNENISSEDITSIIQRDWNNNYNPKYDINTTVKSSLLINIKQKLSNKINISKIFNNNIPYDIKDSFYNIKDNEITCYTILSGLQFPNNRLNEMKQNISKVEDNLIKRISDSQNQKLKLSNWKINNNLVNNSHINKSTSLSERLNKYRRG